MDPSTFRNNPGEDQHVDARGPRPSEGARGGVEGRTRGQHVVEEQHAPPRHGAGALDLTAADAMTRAVQTTTPQTTVGQAMATMTAGRFRHLPVIDDQRMAGIISIGDVVKARLDDQSHEVETLRAYVAGS